MKLTLRRFEFTSRSTAGELLVDGAHECFTVEDAYRDGKKVPGETCIPPGEYDVEITHSPRFGVLMPLIHAVPGFTGVRIHAGNDHRDTKGCPLVVTALFKDGYGDFEGRDSRKAYEAFFKKLSKAGGRARLTIVHV